jgi:hypothetical protein
MDKISPLSRIFISLAILFAAVLTVVFLFSVEVAAGGSSQIDPNISVTPSSLPFGRVFPEEVFLKPIKISLSASCLTSQKIQNVGYTITQKAKAKNSKDAAYCATNPADTVKCYPSLCPYLSKTPDGTPQNDSGVPAFHDPNATSSIAYGQLNIKTDSTDTWQIDLHVPCFKGECAQDNIIPKAYELDPKLIGAQFACDLNIEVASTSSAPPPPPKFVEKEGTIGFWKNWDKHNTYTQTQINSWLSIINASSSWLIIESGYSANVSGMVSLISDASGCNGAQRSCAKKKFLAQYLATRLNIESGRKILSSTYSINALTNLYWGSSNPVSLATAIAKTEGKLPDTGINPTITQFLLLQTAFDGINNTGI